MNHFKQSFAIGTEHLMPVRRNNYNNITFNCGLLCRLNCIDSWWYEARMIGSVSPSINQIVAQAKKS